MLSSMTLTPGQGIDFGALGARPAGRSSAVYVLSSMLRLDAGLHHGRRHPADGLPAPPATSTAKLGRLPLRYFDSHPRGDLLSRVTNDIDNIGQSLQQSLTQLDHVAPDDRRRADHDADDQTRSSPSSRCWRCRRRWSSRSLIVGRSQKQFVAQWASTGALNGHVEEMHTGHAIVKAFGRQREAIAAVRRGERPALPGQLPGPVHVRDHPARDDLHLEPELRGDRGHRRPPGRSGPADRSATSSRSSSTRASSRSRSSRRRASSTSSSRRSPRPSGCSSCSTRPRRSPTRRGPPPWARAGGAVAFEDVSFRYEPDKPLIDDLSLAVEAGETVAIVGPTGAGKTTLVNLLMRFYELDGGRITVDGVDTRELTRDDLRRQFGMVLQDTWLFHGTIRENIAYGRLGRDRGGDPRGRRGRPRRPLRPDAAGRLRHGHRRRRDEPVRGREAAADDRPGVPRRPADPHPRRGDVARSTRGPRSSSSGRWRRLMQRPHDVRHRAPALDDPRRRHDPRHGPRRDRRAGRPRGAARRGAASTTTCTTASSRRRSPRRAEARPEGGRHAPDQPAPTAAMSSGDAPWVQTSMSSTTEKPIDS